MSIRVLIADDSAVMRRAITLLLRDDKRLQVVGAAADGVEAVMMTKDLRPDVVTMDVQMPRLDGLEATAAIMATTPARILLVCNVDEQEQQRLSFRAIEAGALEVIAKPSGSAPGGLEAWGRRLAESIVLMAEVPVVTRIRGAGAHAWPAETTRPAGRTVAVGIVASTGGPPALAQILSELPAGMSFPLFVAQHMAPGFVSGLVSWLAHGSALPVSVASNERPQPGHVYLPPDGHDLTVEPSGGLRLTPSLGGVCPNGNHLLHSLARVYGAGAAGIVLTGMGEDGADGLGAIRRAGGLTFAQDARSSVVFGMPQVAATSGAAARVLPLDSMAAAIRALASPAAQETSS